MNSNKSQSILSMFQSIIISFVFRVSLGLAIFTYGLQNYLLEITLKDQLVQNYKPLYKIADDLFKHDENLFVNMERQHLLEEDLKTYFQNQHHLAFIYLVQKENNYLLAENVKSLKFSFASHMKASYMEDYERIKQDQLDELIVTEYSIFGYPKSMRWIIPVYSNNKTKQHNHLFDDDLFDNVLNSNSTRTDRANGTLMGFIDIGVDTEMYHQEFLIYWFSTLLLSISLMVVIGYHLRHKIEKKYSCLKLYINDFQTLIQRPEQLHHQAYHSADDIQEVHTLRQYIVELQNELNKLNNDKTDSFERMKLSESELKHMKMFFATITHEVRNNLNIINGLHTLNHPANTEKIDQNIKGLLKFTNDILDLTKIEAHQFELVIRIFNIKNLLQELVDYYMTSASIKHICLVINCEFNEHYYFYGDDIRIKQVFANLISNAIKFSSEYSEVIMNLKLDYLEKQTYRLTFEIKDFGVGINPEFLKDLFQPYQQLHTQKHALGTGLGLVICKEIIDLMKGEIKVLSKLNEGSIFTVLFNLEIADNQTIEKYLRRMQESEVTQTKKPSELKILIVDDVEFNRQLLEQLLKNINILSCDQAENGLEAFEKYKENEYDLIFMDIQMPILDGFKASKMIKEYALNYVSKTPIIIGITANYVVSQENQYDSDFLDKILLKPFNPNQLFEIITEFFPTNFKDSKKTYKINDNKIDNISEVLTDVVENKSLLVKHIDINLGIESAYGNKENWLKAVNIVFGQLENFMNQLKYHHEYKAYESIRKVAHKLAGSVAYCGMPILHQALKNLEIAIVKQEDESIIHSLLLECQKEASEILKIAIAVNYESLELESYFEKESKN